MPTPSGTPFSTVFDSFSMLVNDYRLTALYQTSVTDFQTYLQGWLEHAVLDFDVCDQSLAFDTTVGYFAVTLTDKNILLLARFMVKYWLEKEVNDVTQMSIHIQDRDFKTFSEAQNLQAKTSYLMTVKEELSQTLVDYGLKTNDWTSWLAGTFYTP
jgi:hypothetical protein